MERIEKAKRAGTVNSPRGESLYLVGEDQSKGKP